MSEPDTPRTRRALLLAVKGLFLYILPPVLLLCFLAEPVMESVRASGAAAFRILLAALTAVAVNWVVYRLVRGKLPTLPVLAFGALCLAAVAIVEQEALPPYEALPATLSVIAGLLAMACMLLMSFWLAKRRSRFAHVAAVALWIILGLLFFRMGYKVFRDIEGECATVDTWITLAIMALMVPACFSPLILASRRRKAARRRASATVPGWIQQVVGETGLDRDEDLVTKNYARVQYEVDGVMYETRAAVSRTLTRRYGRKAFLGREVTVFHDPADPSHAIVNRIDKHLFDRPKDDE